MKISFLAVGKQHENIYKEAIHEFSKRISNYYKTDWQIIPPPKNAASLSETELKNKEAESILHALSGDDFLVSLDENGKQFTSIQLAGFIENAAVGSVKNMVLLIGGAYGLHQDVIKKSNMVWSLSALTFPHQLVRVLLTEQIYRACTIIKGQKYHHQ